MATVLTYSQLASEDIKEWVARFKGSKVVAETNKRIVIKCPDVSVAETMARQIHRMGYPSDVRKGIRSNDGYIQAWF